MEEKKYSLDLGGKTISIEFKNWVERANSAVLVRVGDTVVLTTVTMSESDADNPFFPLTVEYREKYYAGGKIGGSRFMRREGKPQDDAVLDARMIDRTIRPLFNHAMRREVQIVNTILSYDEENPPDMPALIGTSTALTTSSVPWEGPIGGVTVGKSSPETEDWKINPSEKELEENYINVVVSGPEERINMIETDAKEAPEKDVLEAVKRGQECVNQLTQLQNKIKEEMGKTKEEVTLYLPPEDLKNEIREKTYEPLKKLVTEEKIHEDGDAINEVRHRVYAELEEKYGESHPEYTEKIREYFEEVADEVVHEAAIKNNKRVDGRKMDEIRSLSAEVGVLPQRTHGSGLFMRGLTHGLTVTTLDTPGEEKLVEEMQGESKKRFMLHYNFPPYSTGEPGRFAGPKRREIGHGALAEKALAPLIPSQEEFPYVIRLVTEILSSNGSTSMASVCSGSLALMDASVPIKKHVAGIAMGLMSPEGADMEGDLEKDSQILTDIQGPEDHYGDMDLKVAGTKDGITAIQLDTKIKGLTLNVLEKAINQAKNAREQILEVLESTISQPKKEVSPYAPVVKHIKIDPQKIGLLIGSGGSTIREVMEETQTEINVEDNGSVFISGTNRENVNKAVELAENLTREIKVGEVFDAKVIKIADFGFFVELVPGQEALVHISEIKEDFVKDVENEVSVGDRVKVKVINIDEQGKMGASMKQAEETND